MNRRIAGPIALLVLALATIGCDRMTKHAAMAALAGAPGRSFLADTVRLGYVENPGGLLSIGASWPAAFRTAVFTAATGLLLLAVVFAAILRNRDTWLAAGLTLFAAGGASNWVDRVMRGSVVDFLNVGVGPVRTGVFNLADVAIMLGVAIVILREIRGDRREPDSTARVD